MKSKKNCAYFEACGSPSNCACCEGYRPDLPKTWAQGRKDAREGLPARCADRAYIDGYYNIKRGN